MIKYIVQLPLSRKSSPPEYKLLSFFRIIGNIYRSRNEWYDIFPSRYGDTIRPVARRTTSIHKASITVCHQCQLEKWFYCTSAYKSNSLIDSAIRYLWNSNGAGWTENLVSRSHGYICKHVFEFYKSKDICPSTLILAFPSSRPCCLNV